jgi:predicted phage-related endonuclease
MLALNLVQGSPEWLAARAQYFTASEAPAMLGFSRHMSRSDLLAQKKTGVVPEVDAGTQMLFDRGHETEDRACPIAEGIVGEELFPATGVLEVDGLPLLASFDGITMLEDAIWEHKLLNKGLAECVMNGDLPGTHWPQCEHQMIVAGLDRVLFMTSDGTSANSFHFWYESRPERRAQVLAGWKQFAEDLKTFEPEAKTVKAEAAPIEALPAVVVQVQGSLAVQDNLKTFGERLKSFIDGIKQKPETDQDFADAEAAIKALSKAEDALKQAKAGALEQISAVAEMQRQADLYHDLARATRLSLEKLVKAEKENRKTEIVMAARAKLTDHVRALAESVGFAIEIPADFAGAIKGLKSIDSIKNAADTELASAKIRANELAEKVRANAKTIEAAGHRHMFADITQLVMKAPDDLAAVISSRVAEFERQEAARLEAERARIKAEERAKAERETAEKAEEEAKRIRAEERARAEDEAKRMALADPEATMTAETRPAQVERPAVAPAARVEPVASPIDTGATVTLGQINARLSPISLSKDGIASLGIEPCGRERAAILYREADFRSICSALVATIETAQQFKEAA